MVLPVKTQMQLQREIYLIKKCPRCKRNLPLYMFSRSKNNKDGLNYWCKDCCRENARNWRKKYPERARAKTKSWQHNIRKRVLFLLGGSDPKCVKCGFSDIRAIEVDHIYGGGNKERKRLGGTWRDVYRQMLKMDEEEARTKYQLLCANCNKIKNFEMNKYTSPH